MQKWSTLRGGLAMPGVSCGRSVLDLHSHCVCPMFHNVGGERLGGVRLIVSCLVWLPKAWLHTLRKPLSLERSRYHCEIGIIVVWARCVLWLCLSRQCRYYYFAQEAACLGVRCKVLILGREA